MIVRIGLATEESKGAMPPPLLLKILTIEPMALTEKTTSKYTLPYPNVLDFLILQPSRKSEWILVIMLQ